MAHGEPEISSSETQFYWGWRYSDAHVAAHHGDVYAVTPKGWVGMLGDWSGSSPVLPQYAAAEPAATHVGT